MKKRAGKALLFLAAFLCILATAACGYRLLGSAGALPPTVKTIAVMPFERGVPVLQLDQRVTEAVTREVAQRMRVKVQSTKAGADAVLSGAITAYNVAPLSYDAEGRANRYQVNMAASVKLVDSSGKVLFQSPSYRFSQVYERSGSPSSYINQEVVAYDVVARDFARALVASILEGGSDGR